jgi:hypothetical protein
MTIKPLKPPSTKELENALDELVSALVEHRANRKVVRSGWPSRVTSAADLCATKTQVLRARSIAANPVEYAIKKMMKEVGQLLFDRLGSLDALHKVVDRVADRGDWYRRIAPIDSAFNGVGKGNKRWCS